MKSLKTPELWCVDLVAAAPALLAIEQRAPRLCPLDSARASAFANAKVREEWLATHIALRLIIERAAGRQWRRATFARSDRGKPHLAGAPLTFSLSHAPGIALLGIAREGSIGVDVERARTVRVGAPRRAHIIEAGAALDAAPLPGDEDVQFLRAWVRLEAYAKADGCGIGRLLTRFGILGAPHAREGDARELAGALITEGPQRCVRDLQLGEGIYAAAAFFGAPPVCEVSRLPATVEGLEKLVN